MGRILVVVGILMIIAGFIVPMTSLFSFVGNMNIDTIINPTAAEFCNTGEQLETEAGAATRSGSGSSATTGRTTYYFCVNNSGERREVTQAVVNDVTGGVSGIMNSVGGMLGGGLATAGLSVAGIALIIVGALMMRGSNKPRQVVGAGNPYGVAPTDSPFGAGSANRPPVINFDQQQQNYGGQDAKSVVNFVRDQLDAAYRSGQISRDDYDRAIEKLNKR